MSTTPKSLYRDEGVVLRTQKLGEADRIVTVLTRRHGKVRAVAKGVRRTKSKFGARLEPFSHVDLQLYTGRTLDIVSQAESIRSYGTPIVADYPAYTAGTAVLETADRLTAEEKEPSLRLFLLVVGALRSLADQAHPPGLVLDALLTGDWDAAEASQQANRREGSGLVAALLQWHLERGLRSLALVERT